MIERELIKDGRFGEKNYIVKNMPFMVAVIVSLMLCSVLSSISIDSDIYWTLIHGKEIVENNRFPQAETISWVTKEEGLEEWLDQEWAFETILYIAYDLFRANGLIAVKAILYGLFGVALYLLGRKAEGNFITVLCVTVTPITMMFTNQLRAYIISFILAAFEIYILRSKEEIELKKVLVISVIVVVWINFHGGGAMMFYMIAILDSVSWAIEGKLRAACNRIGIALYGLVAMTLVNPFGFKMVIYPYIHIFDGQMREIIGEWKAFQMKGFFGIVAVALAILTIVVVSYSRDIHEMLFVGGIVVFALLALRNAGYLVVIAMYVCGRVSIRTFVDEISDKRNWLRNIIYGVVMIVPVFLSLAPLLVEERDGDISDGYLDEKIVEAVEEERSERLYTSYSIGAEIAFKTDVRIKSFVDGRYVPYKGIVSDSETMEKMEKGAIEIMDKWEFDGYLVESDKVLYRYLNYENEKFRKVAENERSAYFVVIE
jgi:hypothetical protein